MRLTAEDPNARDYEVWYRPPLRSPPSWELIEAIGEQRSRVVEYLKDYRGPAPERLDHVLWADEETGQLQVWFFGPQGSAPSFGIGTGPVPPEAELPPARHKATLTGFVELRRKVE